MPYAMTAPVAVLAITLAFSPAAFAAGESAKDRAPPGQAASEEKVLIIDAPDLRKAPKDATGPRFTQLLGQEIYSNTGKRIGEIDDFVMANGGEVYAVIDTSNGPIEKLVNMRDDEMMILSLRELRRAAPPKAKPERQSGQTR